MTPENPSGRSGVCLGWSALMQPKGLTEWRLADGTVPDLSCERCGRPTPMLLHGLGFDCCSPNADIFKERDQ